MKVGSDTLIPAFAIFSCETLSQSQSWNMGICRDEKYDFHLNPWLYTSETDVFTYIVFYLFSETGFSVCSWDIHHLHRLAPVYPDHRYQRLLWKDEVNYKLKHAILTKWRLFKEIINIFTGYAFLPALISLLYYMFYEYFKAVDQINISLHWCSVD